MPEEIKAWDTDVRPDGKGLPVGKGTVKQGDGSSRSNARPAMASSARASAAGPCSPAGTARLKADRPDKTVGSFWPDLSTVFDYIKRTMPYGNAQSLSDDEIYALMAFLLNLNDVIKDENFELNEKNFYSIKMPNAEASSTTTARPPEKQFWKRKPVHEGLPRCPKITGRAMSIDVTPDGNRDRRWTDREQAGAFSRHETADVAWRPRRRFPLVHHRFGWPLR